MGESRRQALERAWGRVGGQKELARLLDLTPSALSQWDMVPAERTLEVEKLTGEPRSKLRPDLYPAARELPPGSPMPTAADAKEEAATEPSSTP